MTDERFEQLMRDAARTYNAPPEDPPLDAMWAEIERARGSEVGDPGSGNGRPFIVEERKRSWLAKPWLRMAAVLVLGVALGRVSVGRNSVSTTDSVVATVQEQVESTTRIPGQYQAVMNDYLGETAALLISLPSELGAKTRDSIFVARADDLLLQTRLLMDSPAASDPSLRSLFEDLEVVLVQVVRLKSNRDQMEVDMLTQALQQRDVLPRLRDAVADHIAN